MSMPHREDPGSPEGLPEGIVAGDAGFLTRAIELARDAIADPLGTPFGAVLVLGGAVVGEGTSSVVRSHDVTAHAEVMALRDAGQRLATHLFAGAVMYCSGEPCPLCLAACLWGQVERVVFASTCSDAADRGFEDVWFHRALGQAPGERGLVEVADPRARAAAVAVLDTWATRLGGTIQPKR